MTPARQPSRAWATSTLVSELQVHHLNLIYWQSTGFWLQQAATLQIPACLAHTPQMTVTPHNCSTQAPMTRPYHTAETLHWCNITVLLPCLVVALQFTETGSRMRWTETQSLQLLWLTWAPYHQYAAQAAGQAATQQPLGICRHLSSPTAALSTRQLLVVYIMAQASQLAAATATWCWEAVATAAAVTAQATAAVVEEEWAMQQGSAINHTSMKATT